MATNVAKPGDVLTWTNGTGSAVTSGTIVVVGKTLAVALVDVADGATGSVQRNVAVRAPKVSGAVIAQGEDMSWDVSAGAFDDNAATAASGDVSGAPATANEAAGDGVTTIEVQLTGVIGAVEA